MKRKPTINHLKRLLFFVSVSIILCSCGSKRDIVYFQGVDAIGNSRSINNYNPTIKADDVLTINVTALDFDAARPFNLPATSFIQNNGEIGRAAQQTYLVDFNGNINFPVLGTLKVAGLNRIQATTLLRDLLEEYVKNPIVNIRTMNFKITVLGEVIRPGVYSISNERITVIEALGMAGDMTIQAERKNVLVVREENGKKTFNRIDLTSPVIFNSSVYYLTQNDVIYVEPNSSRVKSATVGPSTGATLSILSILVTAAAVAVSITR